MPRASLLRALAAPRSAPRAVAKLFSSRILSLPCSLPIDLASATVTLRPHAATDAGVDPAKCFTVGTLRRTLLFQCDDACESGPLLCAAARVGAAGLLSVAASASPGPRESRRA